MARHLLAFALLLGATFASKLNVPRVLLPIFEQHNLNFTLEATDGGCYKWTTTRIDIIQLTFHDIDPDLECCMKVTVTGITKEPNRNIAVVFAEDVYTKQILRCDVIVDVIDSLQVFSKTREIFMEEAPEAFDVRAFDSQGNEFTTLEGIELTWNLVTSGPNKDASVIRFTTFKESPYEIPETIKDIEEQGKRGHIVLLEGVKTGSAKVTVKLPQPEYSNVAVHEVQLSVVANLIISPADVYIMIGDYVGFKVIHLNNGQMEEVPMPHSQYYLDVENRAVASINTKTGEVTGLKEGRTRIILHDRNVDENEPGVKLPSATLNVVKPAYMSLSILPHKNWAIILSEQHEIIAEVYSNNDHKIYLGPGVEVHMQVGDAFHVEQRAINGSWLLGWGRSEGSALVEAKLETIVHPSLGAYRIDHPLSAKAEVFIYPRITLNPSEVILPWDPVIRPKYDIDLIAKGGDGKFQWTSNNHSIGSVSQNGHVRTHNYGYFQVTVSMQRNHNNKQIARIYILPPTKLEIVEFVTEAEIGESIHLHIALYAEKQIKDTKTSIVPFTKCQDLPFKVKMSDPNFRQNHTDIISPIGISCGNVAVFSNHVGTSKVTVSYGKDYPLEDSVSVGTFKPLRLLYPASSEVVLALGTTMHLVFVGGPRPQFGQAPSEQKRVLSSTNNDTVKIFDVSDEYPGEPDRAVVRVLCTKLGSSVVSLFVNNIPLIPNCISKESLLNVNVICGKPRAVYLQPFIKVANADSCPMELSSDRVVVQTNQDVELNVLVVDEVGRRFSNISSLRFNWGVYPQDLANLHLKDSTFQRLVDLGGGLMVGNQSYQLVTPNATSGTIDITSNVIGYHEKILSQHHIIPEWPLFLDEDEKAKQLPPITYTIKLYLVDNVLVSPDVIFLYNHPANTKRINVQQGSGFFEISLGSTEVADVTYLEGSRELEILPLQDGELRITLTDLCLVSKPITVLINVVSVSLIRVEMSDKVEIGKCISCIVRMYDEADNLLTLPDLDMLNLKISKENDIVTISRDKYMDVKQDEGIFRGEIHYVITGTELGDTKLIFTIAGVDPEVSSAPMDLQVFPPLKILPKNATILVGSSYQFTSKGGPQPDCMIEYTTSTENVADVNSNGLVKGLAIGHTKVMAKAVGLNPITGQRIIYSEDSVDLQVIPLKGIKIVTSLARFRVNAVVPAWASGVPEHISPLVLGSLDPPLFFNWTVDDPEILQVKSIFQDTMIIYEPEDQVSVRLVGMQKGRTKVNLVVTIAGCENVEKPTILKHSIDIEIFDTLELTQPAGFYGQSVLLAPHSTLQFQTNMDKTSKIRFTIAPHKFSSGTDVQKVGGDVLEPILTIDENGEIKSSATLGTAMVIITSTDDNGLKQVLNVIVEVKPIHYILLKVNTDWKLQNIYIKTIPLGVNFGLTASYFDNTGRIFTSGAVDMRLRNSRFDLLKIKQGSDNITFTVSIKKSGHTVLKSYLETDRRTADYIKIHVSQLITPFVQYVTTGDIICFASPLLTNDGKKGTWSSSDSHILTVDQRHGIAKVSALKESSVSVHHSLHSGAPIHLKVLPPERVVIFPTDMGFITNVPELTNILPVYIEHMRSENITRNILGSSECLKHEDLVLIIGDLPIVCFIQFTNNTVQVDPSDIFTVTSEFNGNIGYYCNVRNGPLRNIETSLIKSDVSISAIIEGTSIQSEPLILPFLPSVYVAEELELEDTTFAGTLKIYGLHKILKHVTVEARDSSLLQVHSPVWDNNECVTYQVSLLDYHWKLEEMGDPLSIKISSKMTDQNIKVTIKVPSLSKFDRDQCAAGGPSIIISFFIKYRHTLTIIISMIVIFFVTFYAYSRYIQPVINVNVNPNQSVCGPPQGMQGNRGFTPPTPVFMHNTSCGDAPSMRQSTPVVRNSSSYGRNEPVFGDPTSFYCTSPEVRHNRRYF